MLCHLLTSKHFICMKEYNEHLDNSPLDVYMVTLYHYDFVLRYMHYKSSLSLLKYLPLVYSSLSFLDIVSLVFVNLMYWYHIFNHLN